jgi:hypothetical protein
LLPAQRDFAVGQLANYLATVISSEKLGAEMHQLAKELIAAAAKEAEKR